MFTKNRTRALFLVLNRRMVTLEKGNHNICDLSFITANDPD